MMLTISLQLKPTPLWINGSTMSSEQHGNVLFNNTLNTFLLRLYDIRPMIKDHSDSDRGKLMLPLSE